jgi:riboflavin synthase
MFTGLIEDVGTVVRVAPGAGGGRTLTVRTRLDPASLAIGDSIATNGVCLTAVRLEGDTFTVDAGPETLARTTIGGLTPGARVNLERSVTLSTRLGGHLVQGHVDAVGRVLRVARRENAWDLQIGAPSEVLRLAVPRGSIAVDGISLTITGRSAESFGVSVIPHTWAVTSLSGLGEGAEVNVEADLVARYVAGLLEHDAARPAAGGLTLERLAELGYGR